MNLLKRIGSVLDAVAFASFIIHFIITKSFPKLIILYFFLLFVGTSMQIPAQYRELKSNEDVGALDIKIFWGLIVGSIGFLGLTIFFIKVFYF